MIDDLQIPNSIKRDVTAVVESLLNRVCHDEDIYHLNPSTTDENQLDEAQLASIDFNRFLNEIENKSNYICEFLLDKTLANTKTEEAASSGRTIFQPMMNSANFLNEPQAFNYFPYNGCHLSRKKTLDESVAAAMESDTNHAAEQVFRTRSLGEMDLKRNSSINEVTFDDKEGAHNGMKVAEADEDDVHKTFIRPRTSSYTDELTSAVRLPKLCFKRKTYLEQLKLEAEQCKRRRSDFGSDIHGGDNKEEADEDEDDDEEEEDDDDDDDDQPDLVYDADEETSDTEEDKLQARMIHYRH